MPHVLSPTLALLLLLASYGAAASAPLQYGYKVVDKKPLGRHTFVQGLQILDDQLYVSSGGYGKSRLERFDFSTGKLQARSKVHPGLFAEGLTVVGDRIYLLTWKSRNLLIYDRKDLRLLSRMLIPGQGWGLTYDGSALIYSDGSDRLYFISLAEKRIKRSIRVTEDGKPVRLLNELEYVDDRIWANVWQSNRIVIINPASGVVEATIGLQGLLPVPERWPETDVLNGIARNAADGGVWVTGKNWPWLYRIELVPEVEVKTPTDVKAR